MDKEREKQAITLVVGEPTARFLLASEAPDFLLPCGNRRLGFEVTSLWINQSSARLQCIQGYSASLFEGEPFYGDASNTAALSVMVPLLFDSALRLFARVYSNGVTIGGLPEGTTSWLAPYGINRSSVGFESASAAIAAKLGCGLGSPSTLDISATLISDIERRVDDLLARLDEFPSVPTSDLDLGTRRYEFEQTQSREVQAAFAPFLALRHKIAKGSGDEVTADAYTDCEAACTREVEDLFLKFRSTTPSWSRLPGLRQAASQFRRRSDLEHVLVRYADLDKELSRLERFGGGILDEWDAAAEFQSDLDRGK